MMTDTRGIPVDFLSGSLFLEPDSGSAIELSQANGKLLISTWVWRGAWSETINYVVGDVVQSGDEFFRAREVNTNARPQGSVSWEYFAQFTMLLSEVETQTYSWQSGGYRLAVRFANNDLDESYMKGRVKVS